MDNYIVVLATGNAGKSREIANILAARGGLAGRLKVITVKEAVGLVPDVDENGDTLLANARIKVLAAREALNVDAVKADSAAGSGTAGNLSGATTTVDINSTADNRRIANAIENRVGYIVAADDSGLFVDCLGGRPGIHSARYGSENPGEPAPPPSRQIELLLAEIDETLKSSVEPEPTARGVCDTDADSAMRDELAFKPRSASFRCVMAISYPDGTEAYTEGACGGYIARQPAGAGGFGYDPIFYLPQKGRTMAEISEAEKNEISHRGLAVIKMVDEIEKWLRSAGHCGPDPQSQT